jgi:hypothetical protein
VQNHVLQIRETTLVKEHTGSDEFGHRVAVLSTHKGRQQVLLDHQCMHTSLYSVTCPRHTTFTSDPCQGLLSFLPFPRTLFYFVLSGVRIPAGRKDLSFSETSRPAVRPPQPPIEWVPGSLSPQVEWQGRESDHSSPSSAEGNQE